MMVDNDLLQTSFWGLGFSVPTDTVNAMNAVTSSEGGNPSNYYFEATIMENLSWVRNWYSCWSMAVIKWWYVGAISRHYALECSRNSFRVEQFKRTISTSKIW